MEVQTSVCLGTALWKMRPVRRGRDRWARTHIFMLKIFRQAHVLLKYPLTPNIFQTTQRRQSAEGREDTTPRKPLGSPSRAASTPTRTGLSENRYDRSSCCCCHVHNLIISNVTCGYDAWHYYPDHNNRPVACIFLCQSFVNVTPVISRQDLFLSFSHSWTWIVPCHRFFQEREEKKTP